MRRFLVFVALVVVMLLSGLAFAAQQGFTLTGRVGATDQEAQEGYFAIDNQTMIVVKPGSDLHNYMRARVGQRVRVTIEPQPGSAEAASSSRRRIAAPTRLSGVEAPDVSPIVTSPSGSQPAVVISAGCRTGLCRIASRDTSPPGSAMWKVGTRSAQMRARLHVLLLFRPPITII